MAQVIWTEPAVTDLDAIADYIALDNPGAANRLVQKVFEHIDQLERHPKSGSVPRELRGSRYRQIVDPPCRVYYRFDGKRVWILHVMRSEQLLQPGLLRQRERKSQPGGSD
jgi:toxin ParE1/3/4